MAQAPAIPLQRTPHRLRADASRNRDRIVKAAREAFVELGAEVPLDEIARRAGVGNATVYRHFSDRKALVHQVTLASMQAVATEAELALAESEDAFEALSRFVHRAVEERIGTLCALLLEGFDKTAPEVVETRERLDAALEEIMDKARKTGQLREDVGVGDLMIALAQLTRPLPGAMCANFDDYVHRHLQLFLDGLHGPARSVLPGVAATFEDLEQKRTCAP